jgi:hypothetical protein
MLTLFCVQPTFAVGGSTELVDTPTAEVIDYYATQMNFRFYANGGILSRVGFGVFKGLNIGFSLDVDKLVGTSNPELRQPALNLKYRLFDGAQQIPAIAIGYDGQGYNYNSSTSSYLEKEKGLYLVFSMETVAKGLEFHIGTNVNFVKEDNKDKAKGYGFIGFDYTIETNEYKMCSFMFEYDNLFQSYKENRFNAAIRMFPAPNLSIDLAARNIVSPKPDVASERLLKVSYQGKF